LLVAILLIYNKLTSQQADNRLPWLPAVRNAAKKE